MRRNSTILKFEGHRVSDGAPADVLRVRSSLFIYPGRFGAYLLTLFE